VFTNGLQPWHIIVLVVVLIVLFGAKRLPDAAKGVGKSMRIFKAEAKAMREEHGDETDTAKAEQPASEQLPAAQPKPAQPTERSAPTSTDAQQR
jgi:sec-independent protein translocase protein TatA